MSLPPLSPTTVAPQLQGLARRLVKEDLMDTASALKAQEAATKQKKTLSQYLYEREVLPPADIAQALSIEFGTPLLAVQSIDLAQAPLRLINDFKLCERHQVLPIFQRGARLFVAMADPSDDNAISAMRFATRLDVTPILALPGPLRQIIEQVSSSQNLLPDLGDGDEEGLGDIEVDIDQAEDTAVVSNPEDDAPIVKFVNKVLLDAIRRGASDIHFEPYESSFRVRFRLDGVLKPVAAPPAKLAARLSSRLKVMSGLDIAERRVPQDGRIKLNLSKTRSIDFRISTCPTLFGEKVVLRVLDPSTARMGIDQLGYEEDQKTLFIEAIHKPYGMVLVTGPTGSGKTVSLYTALNILNTDGRNISTVEDPVEIRVPGINQVAQNPKRGLTFAVALRSFLRQDPDVIMVGEIRDLETAEIAIKAAQTGHMVLSTLHTNDAPQAVARLTNMGVAPYNITSSVSLIIAQRLARRLHSCKRKVALPEETLRAAGFNDEQVAAVVYEPAGCDGCNEGYKGRTGIYQVLPMDEGIQKIILAGGSAMDIAAHAQNMGIPDLRQSGLRKVAAGITSLAEVHRVTVD